MTFPLAHPVFRRASSLTVGILQLQGFVSDHQVVPSGPQGGAPKNSRSEGEGMFVLGLT